ncbi:MAG: type II secretion system protein GspE [Armatimonadetes bacterium CG_4_10_14_3_um_filter_66_18]|nr:Flp pilus assembly complex ATPase component [Armatimonadota bacterium]OIO93072.1 MAG: hypothetical protein AUJ96_31080 [Armatimonadetes bacterium CG2_30_66_41]PIU93709.1 MAG: type II secretion system protein GspE [Armatimonadetes bacterium CG06_land_8_20_14_3_00_66_21]PIX46600.1 MAG: type II secretion system protein GspE [Armatimonadetes bacterium CG_4_8_14_3_um_filter_66_20]PIY53120.1 MAG: type II secretion system protein GspE [Armatimonadetes bacterium CG_4_10_14_3_um_filter_66_18]PIZ4901
MDEDRRIGQLLLDSGDVNETELQKGLSAQSSNGHLLGELLVEHGACSREAVLMALADQLKIRYVEIRERDLDDSVIALVRPDLAFRHQALPLCFEGEALVVALANPFNFSALDDIQVVTGRSVIAALASPDDIRRFVEERYMHRMMEDEADEDVRVLEEAEEEIGDLQRLAKESVVIKIVNMILRQAVQDRASDIHIEPFERGLRVRYRVDGVLHEVAAPPKRLQAAVVSRVKIMADLDIAERRLPQDGRIKISVSGKEVDLRVSTVPTVYGETVVMRLLERSSVLFGLEQLGMPAKAEGPWSKLIAIPHGILLVTGPTGSGKSTTLYASLRKTYSTEKKIITIEDPVEIRIDGINQIQVRPEIGLTFASGLRHIVRQDPDVIMVGEIRDGETAEIAIQSALTGHLVFSTLHTNNSAGAVTRLLEMGVEPYLAASSIEGVLAQRLVRVLCPTCRPKEFPPLTYSDSGVPRGGATPVGCDHCKYTGYYGRTGVYELLEMDQQIRDMIGERRAMGDIEEYCMSKGMDTLIQGGLAKVKEGITTVEEVTRVTREEEGQAILMDDDLVRDPQFVAT